MLVFDKLPHYCDELFRLIKVQISRYNLIAIWWWGVFIGKKPKFIGKTFFKKYPGSSIRIGDNCEFRSSRNSNLIGVDRPCSISTLTKESTIVIGNSCGFSGTVIASFVEINIGKNVRCGANTLITDSDWHLDDPRVGEPKRIKIEDNVWLGVNSVVLKGVTIGRNTVIGANSVVTKDIPADVIAAGNPCRVLRHLKN